MKTILQIETIARLVLIALVVMGCFVVLRPFLAAVLWAAILAFSTWPVFMWMDRRMHNRRTLACVLMVLLISCVLLVPLVVVAGSMADSINYVVDFLQNIRKEGIPPPPEWLTQLPLVGDYTTTTWMNFTENTEGIRQQLRDILIQSRGWILQQGISIAQGILQVALSVLIAFFFYRDGERIIGWMEGAGHRIAGATTQQLLRVAGNTIRGVVYGILGTAFIQAMAAGIGFWMAGMRSAVFLAVVTFFLSFIPGGPPFLWAPVSLWFLITGHWGWGLFLFLWGLLIVSGIDNVVRPYLISMGSPLPFILILLGVMGGMFAFGFIGLFLGPTLLALGHCMLQEFVAIKKATPDQSASPSLL